MTLVVPLACVEKARCLTGDSWALAFCGYDFVENVFWGG